MSDEKKGHVHHGKTTRNILNPGRVLTASGLKSGDTLLDAGSGDGFISFAASQLVGEKGIVYALDAYPESVANIKEEAEKEGVNNLETIFADLTDEIPLDDNSVDVCVMANVLHGFVENNEVEEVMKEISRVVKSEGVFAVAEFKKLAGPPGPPLEVKLSPQDVEDILVQYDFEPVSSWEVGQYHYLVKGINQK